MQLIVLGMHRSGTSTVARILNMMGAYFAPDEVSMQVYEDNPKGYWEREDVRVLNDDILRACGTTWDNINKFDISQLTDEILKEFSPRIQKIIFGLDAHRPWMVKDPRLCLLLPVWSPLLEVPVYIYVYRNPIQIAQSLKKREKSWRFTQGATLYPIQESQYLKHEEVEFPITLGMALWEKYTLSALSSSKDVPQILISYHKLMSNPVETIKVLYDKLAECEVQGLHLPSDREIKAFIEPALHRQKGDSVLQSAYINTQQLQLVKAFEEETIFELDSIPELSQGASEALEEYQNKLRAAEKILEYRQEIANRDGKIASRDQSIAQLQEHISLSENHIANLTATLQAKEQEISVQNQSIAQLQEHISLSENHIANLTATLHAKEQEILAQNQSIAQLQEHTSLSENHIANLTATLQAKEQENEQYQNQSKIYQSQWLIAEDRAVKLKQEIAKFNTQLQTLQLTIVELQNYIADKEQNIAEKEREITTLTHQLNLQNEDIQKLIFWISALGEDIKSVFNSITWRSGRFLTKIALAIMFKKVGLTAQDHIRKTLQEASRWKPSATDNSSSNVAHTVQNNIIATEQTMPLLTNLKKVILENLDNSRDYQNWIKEYDTLTSDMQDKMRKRITEWHYHPLISIVMPTYNTDEKWLRAAIESVQNQVYPNWELCIADDASTQPQVREILKEYTQSDQRIKVIFREQNGHISAASNSALEMVTGEFVALLDHDDVLPQHALFWVVQTIIDHPNAMLLYSDEDKIDENGKRYDPYFKTDWNPDLFLSHNMISHLGIYQMSIVQKIGGFREGYEGSQDYDLALRAIEHIQANQIYHIPRVLYHWRALYNSTASSSEAKPYAIIAAKRAISDYLARKNIVAQVSESIEAPGAIRVQYIINHYPLVSLIIPTYNGLNLLKKCIESIVEKTDYPNYEVIIVDNASDDPETIIYLQKLKDSQQAHILHYPKPFNYSAINNMAVEYAKGEIIGLLNNDLEVINAGWLTEMVSHVLRAEVGIVGARLWYPSETLQHAGVIVGLGGIAGHAHSKVPGGSAGYFGRAALLQNFSAVTGACMLMKKSRFLEVGGLDSENLAVAFNDIDLCLKIVERGLRIVWTPYAELYHHESASRGNDDTPEKRNRFLKEIHYMENKWNYLLFNDPAYNPNLTLSATESPFSFAWPPRVSQIV